MGARHALVLLLLAGCAARPPPGDAPGDAFRLAHRNLASTPYDAPGTAPNRLSPEVVRALAAPPGALPAAPDAAGPEDAPARHLRRERVERALAEARTDYDRSWLALELARLQAEAGDCAAALRTLAPIGQPGATPVERVQAAAEAGRIRAGVCWTTARWQGYRFRPLPEVPRRGAGPPPSGTVDLVLHVTAAGTVADAAVERGSLRVLELAALRAVQRWRYQPLVVDGRALPFALRQRFVFQGPVVLLPD